jgi:cellulose synthase/poly-beta-1,6-N-acetylglucosamine synthase-like glycosyltransferase
LRAGEELPFISIVVISKDRHEELEKAVASLSRLDYPATRYEVVVVEEGDTPHHIEGVHYVFLPRRDRGLGYARNTGVSHARGDIVAFTDDDCLVDPGWLHAMVAQFADPKVMGVAGATFAQLGCGLIGMCEDLLGFPGGGHKRYHACGGREGETNLLSGCNCAYRKGVFEDTSFKEDGYGRLGADDFLMGLTVAARGKCMYAPQAVVYHKPRGSFRAIVSWFTRRRINELLFEEEEEGRKSFAFLFRKPQRVILFRVALGLSLPLLFGKLGLGVLLLAILAWCGLVILRSLPAAQYFPSRVVVFGVPVVRVFMDFGILVAEWRYLTRSHESLGFALGEYRR